MTAIDQSIVDPTNEQVSHLKLYDDEPTNQPTNQPINQLTNQLKSNNNKTN